MSNQTLENSIEPEDHQESFSVEEDVCVPSENAEQRPSEKLPFPNEPANDNSAEPQPPTCPPGVQHEVEQPTAQLFRQHEAELRASGLREETWRAQGVYSTEDPVEITRLLSWSGDGAIEKAKQLGPCIVYPYAGVPGYVRLKPDTPRTKGRVEKNFGDAFGHNYGHQDPDDYREPIKYEAPVGSEIHAYVPSSICANLDDPRERLYITEGEKKTLLVAQEGAACVGLSGVDCGHNKQWLMDEGSDLLISGLRERVSPDREVCVLFDVPDMTKNLSVIRAAVRITRMVLDRDAVALVGYLDPVPGASKVGVDDWFVHMTANESPNAITGDFALARPARPTDLLDWLKERAADEGWTAKNASMKRLLVEAATWVRVWHEKDNKAWRVWAKEVSKAFKLEDNVLDSMVKHLAVGAKKKTAIASDVWWMAWVAANEVKYSPKQGTFTLKGKAMEAEILLGHAYLDADAQELWRQGVDNSFKLWLWREKAAVIEELRRKLPYVASFGVNELRAFVRAVTGKEDPVDIAVFAHFIWQVKRKLHGMPVDRHLMPVLCGAQGAGKSTAVRLLLGPVNMRVDEAADLKMLEDERQLPRLAENLVVFFDEMSKATSTDVDALKNRITAPTVKWRVLGTNTHNVRDQLATFIGASNNFVRDLIHDPSGMRRFYELNCQPKLDWVVLNSIDYAALWLSVDHTRPSPLDEHLVEVERRQDATRNQDSVEEFVEQCCIRDASGTEWIPGGLVYNEYAAWMKKQMRPPFSMTKFGRRLKVLLGEGSYKESNGMKYRLKFRFSFGSILHVVATDSQ